MEIKRWDLELTGYDGAMMSMSDDGEYVLHSDHIAAMAELKIAMSGVAGATTGTISKEFKEKVSELEAENKLLKDYSKKWIDAGNDYIGDMDILQAKLDKAIECLKSCELYPNGYTNMQVKKTLAEITEEK